MKFKYRIKAFGEEYIGNDIDDIISSIVKSSGKPREEVEPIVKSKLAPFVRKIKDKILKHKSKVGLKEAAAGARSAFRQMTGINVDQQEINRRAIICSKCPKKSEVSGCVSCGFGASLLNFKRKIVSFFKGDVIIPNNLEKSYCSVCSCSLGMMLPAKLEDFLDSTKQDKDRPSICWLKNK